MSPFFIFYDARSGSTYLSKLLVDNIGFVIPPESRFLGSFINTKFNNNKIVMILQFIKVVRSDKKIEDWKINFLSLFFYLFFRKIEESNKLLDLFIKYYLKKNNLKEYNISCFGFKKGGYYKFFNKIVDIYPDVKIIFIIRDGRAVFLSKKNSIYSVTGKPFETDPKKAAEVWCNYIDAMESIIKTNPDNILVVKYEDLINNTDKKLEEIRNYLGTGILNLIPGKYKYYVPKRYGNLHDNIEKEPLVSHIDRWKKQLSEEEIRIYEKYASEKLKKYGYI